jgi:hypothetical protein
MSLGLLFLIWSTFSPAALHGQESSPYQSFDIYIYPEYDHPGVGVYIEAEVKPGQVPRYLEIDVPEETSVAIIRKPSQTEAGGDRIEVQRRDGRVYLPVDVSESQFQIQYYFNPFKDEETVRSLDYEFAVNDLLPEFHVIVQRPLAALNFQHSLEDPEELDGDFDLVFFRQHILELQAGTKYPIRLSYENPTGALTMSLLQTRMEQAQAEAAQHPEGSAEPSNLTLTLIVIGGLVVLLIVVLRFWNGKKVRSDKTETPKKTAPKSARDRKTKVTDAGFCNNCGSPRRAGAKFCPDCGKEL